MSWLDAVLALIVVVLAVGWYLSYTAARLHRLHSRVEGAYAVLDAQLVRRAEAALEWSHAGACDPASALLLADAAAESLRAADAAVEVRELVESTLTAQLRGMREVLPQMPWEVRIEPPLEAMDARVGLSQEPPVSRISTDDSADSGVVLIHTHERVRLARRFYNDAVADTVRLRRQPIVRLFRLAGRTHLPRACEFDDDLSAQ